MGKVLVNQYKVILQIFFYPIFSQVSNSHPLAKHSSITQQQPPEEGKVKRILSLRHDASYLTCINCCLCSEESICPFVHTWAHRCSRLAWIALFVSGVKACHNSLPKCKANFISLAPSHRFNFLDDFLLWHLGTEYILLLTECLLSRRKYSVTGWLKARGLIELSI